MDHKFHIETEHFFLTPLLYSEIEALRCLRNIPENCQYFFNQTYITKEMQERWFSQYIANDHEVMLSAKLHTAPSQFIGCVGIQRIDYEKRSAEVGCLLLDSKNLSFRGGGD